MKIKEGYLQEIDTYYEECLRDYEIVWQLKDAMALHYGFWDKDTLTHRQALWNMNFQVARHAQIKKGDKVLDAGCGVGGTSFFLAKNFGCHVEGISITPAHIRKADELKNKQLGIDNLVNFSCQDFCKTNFPDESFDVIIGIESVCHATPKISFLKEAFRLLKPGGRLIIADYFLRPLMSKVEEETLANWGEAWAINDFIFKEEFMEFSKEAGFKTCLLKDISKETYPSVKLMHRSYYPGIFISRISNFFGRRTDAQVTNSKSGKFQYQSYNQGVWKYGFFVALKNDFLEKIDDFDQFIKNEPEIEIFRDEISFKNRFPIISKKGFSIRNFFKRIMHWYLESGIKNADKKF